MIFLKKQNLLFLKARKVAGTSFEIALSKYAGPTDIITPIEAVDEKTREKMGFRGAQNYKLPFSEALRLPRSKKLMAVLQRQLPYKYFNHISACEVKHNLGRDVFDRSFKVAIVRNPFDKLVSQYFWFTRSASPAPSFNTWLLERPGFINDNYKQYFVDGANIIDFYVRYENFEEDTRKLETIRPELAGLFDVFSSLSAKGSVRPKTAGVSSFFKDDNHLVSSVKYFNSYLIEKFDYDLQ